MNCPKCKELIKTGDVFCRSCGEKLNIDEPNEFIEAEEKIKNEQEIQNTDSESNQEKSITFDDLVDAYIGKNASKLKGGFSFCTLFFGYIYVFYRKMWLLGFIWLLISILLYNHFWIALGLNVFIAFCFKEIYLSYVDGKVRKIKEQYSNYSGSQLVYICSKKGGTTIIPVIISVIIGLLIPILSTVIVLNTINDDIDNVDIMQEDTIVIDQNQW